MNGVHLLGTMNMCSVNFCVFSFLYYFSENFVVMVAQESVANRYDSSFGDHECLQ